MKKLLTAVTAVAILSSVASAELLKNFKYNGSLEVNGYNINNADFDKNVSDKYGDVDTRLMLNMGFDLNDDANAVVTIVKDNRQWGTESERINGDATNDEGILNNLYIDQAYLNLKGVIGIDHKVGRQFYGNPGDLVIYYGPKMWPYQVKFGDVSAIDAWVGTYNYKDWTFTGILGKEFRETGNMGTNLSGLDVKTKIDRFNLNAYYYYNVDNSTTTPASDKLGLYGLRANWDCNYVEGLNIGGEYDQNDGSDENRAEYKGYAWKVNAGYTTDKLAGKLGLKAEYAYLSGENASTTTTRAYTPINNDYRPGIISDGFGLSKDYLLVDPNDPTKGPRIGTGAKVFKVGANWTPEKLSKLNIAFDYINAKVATQRSLDNNLVSDSALKNTTLGNEYDFVATWNHSDNVSVKGYYAMFKPEKANVKEDDKKVKHDDMETALGAALVVKF